MGAGPYILGGAALPTYYSKQTHRVKRPWGTFALMLLGFVAFITAGYLKLAISYNLPLPSSHTRSKTAPPYGALNDGIRLGMTLRDVQKIHPDMSMGFRGGQKQGVFNHGGYQYAIGFRPGDEKADVMRLDQVYNILSEAQVIYNIYHQYGYPNGLKCNKQSKNRACFYRWRTKTGVSMSMYTSMTADTETGRQKTKIVIVESSPGRRDRDERKLAAEYFSLAGATPTDSNSLSLSPYMIR